jgi:hypothetical protein
MPSKKEVPTGKNQVFSCNLRLVVSSGNRKVTEAELKRWLKGRLKDCELGTLTVGQPVEFSETMKRG